MTDVDSDDPFDFYHLQATTLENKLLTRTYVKEGYLETYRKVSDLQDVSYVEIVDSEFFSSYQ